ncbi:MAG TPA: hypothetical protein VK327_16455 [Candidatus Paceibacterota bacterium]|nr:hypothetical protein [Candidatus Paceibacterota bacterium]
MKTTLSLLVLLASFSLARAQDAVACSESAYGPAISYAAPVVYQAPVIYQAPVNYYAPVFYVATAASAACYVACPPTPCPSPSTVVHITGGRGVYVTSNCDSYNYCGSSVVYIGGRYAQSSRARYWRR